MAAELVLITGAGAGIGRVLSWPMSSKPRDIPDAKTSRSQPISQLLTEKNKAIRPKRILDQLNKNCENMLSSRNPANH